ncbi:hypothetical protein EON64_05550 [archaeon]|nr:MAG: hypothetical protein EON64_05550 [archaeon]
MKAQASEADVSLIRAMETKKVLEGDLAGLQAMHEKLEKHAQVHKRKPGMRRLSYRRAIDVLQICKSALARECVVTDDHYASDVPASSRASALLH